MNILFVMVGGALISTLVDRACGVRVEGPFLGRIIHVLAMLSWGALLWAFK